VRPPGAAPPIRPAAGSASPSAAAAAGSGAGAEDASPPVSMVMIGVPTSTIVPASKSSSVTVPA
jgi:hypothetical protein